MNENDNNCGNCSMANKNEDCKTILKCECPLSGCYGTDVLKSESCNRHRQATKEWIAYLNS